MRFSDLTSRILVILVGLGFIAWCIYQLHKLGMSYLAIALIIPIIGILGFILLLFFPSPFGRVPEAPLADYWGVGKQAVAVDFSSPLNRGVLEYLRKRNRKAELVSASPTSVEDLLNKTMTHPEVAERLWDTLAASLPVDCRWIVCGAMALVHPQMGVLFGVGIGTAYCLRLTDADMESALKTGASTEIRWSSGSPLDLASQFGPSWVEGSWQQVELEWCHAEYETLGKAAAEKAIPEEGVS